MENNIPNPNAKGEIRKFTFQLKKGKNSKFKKFTCRAPSPKEAWKWLKICTRGTRETHKLLSHGISTDKESAKNI